MQRHQTLFERPVILSENRRNVIPHGRPLSPIGTVRSTSPFFVPRQAKGSFHQEKHGDTLSLKSPSSVRSTTLMQYHKSAQDNLITINNNLSIMLKESFAGIDSICQKVRLCLLDAKTVRKPEKYESLPTVNRTESHQPLSTCEEEGDSKATNDDVPDIEEEMEENIAELEEENNEATLDGGKQKKEPEKVQSAKKPKKTPSITPFFTILNPKTHSTDSVSVKMIKSMSSKLTISRKCTADNFHKTMKEVEKLTDYEQFLTSMVDDINKEIDECYSKYTKKEDDRYRSTNSKNEDRKKDSRPSSAKGSKRKCSPLEPHGQAELKKYRETMKIYKDLMEDQFSENELTSKEAMSRGRGHTASVFAGKMDFTCPDVYRKRAITDLHKRLEAQVEANDSLIFFQKLMSRNKKFMKNNRPESADNDKVYNKSATSNNPFKGSMQYLLSPQGRNEERKQRSLGDLSKKYQDSLWFRQKKHESKRSKKEAANENKKKRQHKRAADKQDEKILPKSYTVQRTLNIRTKTNKNSVAAKTPSHASICSCRIKVTNDQPISEAQRCKLHWMRAKYSQLSHKKLKHLDILDDITKNDLLPIRAEYPRRDEIKSTKVKESYLQKLMNAQDKDTQNAWEQLFQPSLKCALENCDKCNTLNDIMNKENKKTDSNNNEKVKGLSENHRPSSSILEKGDVIRKLPSNPILEKGDVIRKLSKYIFLEQQNPTTSEAVFTVMPVHVFHDNLRATAINRRTVDVPQKLPLVPMKETKEFLKKAEWNDTQRRSRPMRVIYDPILRKIEKEIRMVSARQENRHGTAKIGQTNSWSPKNFSQYCSPPHQSPAISRKPSVKIDVLDKTAQKLKRPSVAKERIQLAEINKRSPKASSEKVFHPTISPRWNSPLSDSHAHAYNTDKEVKQKIQKTINMEAQARMKSDQERKMWENKYGKSAAQKLLNFIEKQPVPYQIPIPKYALPKTKVQKDPSRQQLMLEQLRSLKEKNDNIQSNIQKAIDVIENKMVDILSKPTTSESIEAFDEMEKEITGVLTLMKTTNSKKKEKLAKVEECATDVDRISDELFRRLDRILESPVVSSSGKSSIKSLSKQEKAKRKQKSKADGSPVRSTDMNQVCFSSTSASGEEKFTITAISPKRSYKSSTTSPYIKNSLDTSSTVPDDVSTIASELRKLENELKLDRDSEEVEENTVPKVSESFDEFGPVEEKISSLRPSILKNKKVVPIKEQVVNLALFDQPKQTVSIGDQLQALNKLLEVDLKSEDLSVEKTNSTSEAHDQGDYSVQNLIGTGDERSSLEKTPGSDDVIEDSIVEKDQVVSTDNTGTEDLDGIKNVSEGNHQMKTEPSQEKVVPTSTTPENPKETIVDHREPIVLTLNQSQHSTEVTGPYYTPLTSPLMKNRLEEDPAAIGKETKPIGDGDDRHHGDACEEEDGNLSVHRSDQKEDRKQGEHGAIEVKEEQNESISGEDKESPSSYLAGDEDSSVTSDFYENVNKIITRVENVYSQLEEFEEEMLLEEEKLHTTCPTGNIAVFREEPRQVPQVEADTFLTPFMHAVKDLRKPTSRNSSPRMHKSPSFYNVLSFLDNLADFKHEVALEVYTSR